MVAMFVLLTKRYMIMKTEINRIQCPACSHEFDANEILTQQVADQFEKVYKEKELAMLSDVAAQKADLEQKLLQAELLEAKQEEIMAQRVREANAQLKQELERKLKEEAEALLQAKDAELLEKSNQLREYNKMKGELARVEREKLEMRDALEAELALKMNDSLEMERKRLSDKFEEQQQLKLKQVKADWEAEQALALAAKEAELAEKSQQLKEYNQLKASYAKMEREKLELKEILEAEHQIRFNRQLEEERERIQKQAESQNELRVRELEKKLEDQKKLTEEMKRKQEQGSMQLQGEIQELAIEEYIRSQFPLDVVEEVKKGAVGADCLQIVNTYEREQVGTIYYESKRTKSFGAGWIEKFKADILAKGADIGVLVTEVLPEGMQRMGLYQGVYVCTLEEFKGLVNVLRQFLIGISQVKVAQENKGDKMVMLYDFLTSTEFRMQVEGIVEGFTQMQSDLQAERRAMQSMWKKREKQLMKVMSNTVYMYSSIRGIAGAAVQKIDHLELDEIAILDEAE